MARTSRRPQQLSQSMEKVPVSPDDIEPVNRTAIYARLSLFDRIHADCEASIQMQIQLLKEYVSSHPEFHLEDTYIDRGWTGTNFQRPAFLRMIEDIQAKKINCIIVKDLSRFGRSYWEAGYFLEVLLPKLKVRFLSITDNFDSKTSDPGSLAIILKNIMNDFFSRDLSRRFCDSYDLRKAGGVFRKGEPYGYRYDTKCPKHLTFDPEESYYVRMIFTWALEGVSNAMIARRLRDMKAPVPSSNEYQRPSIMEADDPRRWSNAMVRAILTNRLYTGDFVCGKSCRRRCDPFHYRPHIPQEEWIIIPDSHPAYISHEEYDQIARRMRDYSIRRRQQIADSAPEYKCNPNIYRSKLVCPVCGGIMSAALAKRNQPANRLHYVCFQDVSRTQKTHYIAIGKKMLDMIVLNQLHTQCHLAGLLSSWLRSPEGKRKTSQRLEVCQETLNQSKRQYDHLKEAKTALFENHAEYIIHTAAYTKSMSLLREQLRSAAEQMEKNARQLATLRTALTTSNPWLKLFTAIPYPNEIDASLVQKTVDRILVRSEEDAEVIFLHQEFLKPLWTAYLETDVPLQSCKKDLKGDIPHDISPKSRN